MQYELCRHIKANGIQCKAPSVVINALATGHLDTKRATALLYGLQLAATNSARIQAEPFAPSVVRTLHSTPDGLDLAEPGAVYEIPEYEEDEEDDEDDAY